MSNRDGEPVVLEVVYGQHGHYPIGVVTITPDRVQQEIEDSGENFEFYPVLDENGNVVGNVTASTEVLKQLSARRYPWENM